MTTIRIHFLGGTIGYAGTADGGAVRLSAEALLAAVPGLDRLAVTLDVHSPQPVPSASLTFAQLSELAREAADACAAGAADAVVVVQGTDTLEESAYLIDLLWDRPEPVVLTGAMRNPTLAGADGPANLLAAASVAADPRVPGAGCAHRAGRRGALGSLGDQGAHDAAARLRLSRRRAAGSGGRGTTEAPAATGHAWGHPQTDGTALRTGAGADRRAGRGPLGGRSPGRVADGLVVAALGGGHVPGRLVDPLGAVAELMPVVLASRVDAGRVLTSTYRAPGSETDLLGRGLVSSGFLGAAKSRILLIAALACDTDRAWLSETFAHTG